VDTYDRDTKFAPIPLASLRARLRGAEQMTDELYGTRAIREARLEAFDNRTPDRDYTIQFNIPEFTCLCPISGFPDFATLHIRYVPGPRCVELKSLKLYINGYRNQKTCTTRTS